MPRLLPRRVESLEHRTLLAVNFDLVDMGVTTAAAGEGVYDVSGFVLGPNEVTRYDKGKLYVSRLARSKAVGHRFGPGTSDVLGSKVMPGFSAPHAVVFGLKAGDGYVPADVGTLDPVGPSFANAMGPRSRVVGNTQVPGGDTHGFYATYANSHYTMLDLNDFRPAGMTWTIEDAVDINAGGQILVRGTDAGGLTQHAVIRPSSRGNDGQELPVFEGGTVEVFDLNDLGEAVGSGTTAVGLSRALLWRTTRSGVHVIELGELGGGDSRATRTNNHGYVVGDATTVSDRSHAFLYDPAVGGLADLNTLVNAGGLTLRHAGGIDDNGRIVCEATDADGNRHVVLLLPQDPMPALVPGTALVGNVLTINGTTGNDTITIASNTRRPRLLDVWLNGSVTQFDNALLRRVDVLAGPGDDRVEVGVTASFSSLNFFGHSGDDQLVTTHPSLSLTGDGGAGDDLLEGSAGDGATFEGGYGNDTLVGGDRTDRLFGGFGDDVIDGGNAVSYDANVLNGEAGNDTITGGRGRDIVDAGPGDDSVLSAGGADVIEGGDGDDIIDSGAEDDTVTAGAGDDFLRGGEDQDFLYGDAGDDTVWGQSSDDTLGGDAGFVGGMTALPTPEPGNDLLDGGAGNDYLVGSRESLTFADDNGRDTMTGGAGGDVINARGDDVVTDVSADDVVPALRRVGPGPLVVQQTATLTISIPPIVGAATIPTALPGGAGKFDGSAFYADADGTLHMQDTVAREFTLGEFFQNWGVMAGVARRGRFGGFGRAMIKVNGVENPAVDRWVVHAGDVVNVVVSV